LRINSAADDAAGLGISEKMRAQIRGLDQASRNAQDGISLIQTAEGAMSTINEMVIRVRELVVQAANDTNAHDGTNDLTLAQSDRVRIQDELNQLLDEIDSTRNRVEFNTRTLLNGSLSPTGPIVSPHGASVVDLRAGRSGGYTTWEYALRADNGVGAPVSLESFINAEIADGAITLTEGFTDVRAWLEGPAALVGGFNHITTNYTPELDRWAAMSPTYADWGAFMAGTGAGLAALDLIDEELGANQTMYEAVREAIVTLGLPTPDGDDFVFAGTTITRPAGSSASDWEIYLRGELGVNVIENMMGNLLANNQSLTGLGAHATVGPALTAWAQSGGYTDFDEWVASNMAYDAGGTGGGGGGGGGTGTPGNAIWFQIGANARQGVRLTIEDVGVNSLSRQATVGTGAGEVREGFTFADLRTSSDVEGAFTGGNGVLRASGEEISEYINAIDLALAHVTGQRSELGAMQNRLEFTIQNLDISSENLSAAESRIRDADMAREMMNLTKTNVLQQAATSMLAQANQAPMTILQLLR